MGVVTTLSLDDVILHLANFKGDDKEFVKEAQRLLCNTITRSQFEELEKRCHRLEMKVMSHHGQKFEVN